MQATLHASHKRLAHEFFLRNPDQDETRHWRRAEDEIVDAHAYFRSQKLANGKIDVRQNWVVAQQVVRWRELVETRFPDCLVAGISRPFLALAPARQLDAIVGHLRQLHDLAGNAVAFIATLDGAPEHARYSSERDSGNDASWVDEVNSKNSLFFEFCRHTLSMHQAKILECGAARPCDEIVDDDRAFEDACVGVVAPNRTDDCKPLASATCNAITAALRLRSYLSALNYQREFHWQEQLHPRLVVASSWEMAMRGLLHAHRDEIVVEDDLFSTLDTCTKRMLLAGGVRLTTSRINFDDPRQ